MQHDVAPQPRSQENLLAALDQSRADTIQSSALTPEQERFEALQYDEILQRLDRDWSQSVMPLNFIVYENPEVKAQRLRRMYAMLDRLREVDPVERRETLEILRAAFDDETATDLSMSEVE
jgi:hypothetical protein